MLAYLIVAIGVLFRITSHLTEFSYLPPNFAPIGAMALFAGYYFAGGKALWVPVVALAISDLVIGLYDPLVMVSVYASFVVITLIGQWLRRRPGIINGTSAVLASALLFFLVTNFAEWLRPGSPYAPDISGLLASYTMALPFFRFTLAGDIFFTSVFFGAYQLARMFITRQAAARVSSHR